ncbi:hypothetical protein [Methanococcus maripaludis]|uniref:Uncharacterized protein n=1 Tax=Methanococcus maripaludis TaxID=39152 RepID=A0A7J9PN09_METMI|nr:hypothetical protein [Methanococcus maripaludis]MBA2863997.1 hypothetical protein [Methanococcus maripaludis]
MSKPIADEKTLRKQINKYAPKLKQKGVMVNLIAALNFFAAIALMVFLFICVSFNIQNIIIFAIVLAIDLFVSAVIGIDIAIWMFVLKAYHPTFFELSLLKFEALLSGKPLNKAQVFVINDAHQVTPVICSIEDNYVISKDLGKSWPLNKKAVYLDGGVVTLFVPDKVSVMYDIGVADCASRLKDLGILTLDDFNEKYHQLKKAIDEKLVYNEVDDEGNILKTFSAADALKKFEASINRIQAEPVSLDDILDYSKSDPQAMKITSMSNAELSGTLRALGLNKNNSQMLGWFIMGIFALAISGVILYQTVVPK